VPQPARGRGIGSSSSVVNGAVIGMCSCVVGEGQQNFPLT
jgi:homoserine kinase